MSPYVRLLLENLAYEILTPNDWKSVAKTYLELGQTLVWLSEYSELCQTQAQRNRLPGAKVQASLEQLAGTGPYGDAEAQIKFPVVA